MFLAEDFLVPQLRFKEVRTYTYKQMAWSEETCWMAKEQLTNSSQNNDFSAGSFLTYRTLRTLVILPIESFMRAKNLILSVEIVGITHGLNGFSWLNFKQSILWIIKPTVEYRESRLEYGNLNGLHSVRISSIFDFESSVSHTKSLSPLLATIHLLDWIKWNDEWKQQSSHLNETEICGGPKKIEYRRVLIY